VEADSRPLARLRSLRVHVRQAGDAPAVCARLLDLLPARIETEIVQAPLCRDELLVEIEGVAAC
jgi:hypothetical protein